MLIFTPFVLTTPAPTSPPATPLCYRQRLQPHFPQLPMQPAELHSPPVLLHRSPAVSTLVSTALVPPDPYRLYAAEVHSADPQLHSMLRVLDDGSLVYVSTHSVRRIQASTIQSVRLSYAPVLDPCALDACGSTVVLGGQAGEVAVVSCGAAAAAGAVPLTGSGRVLATSSDIVEHGCTVNCLRFTRNNRCNEFLCGSNRGLRRVSLSPSGSLSAGRVVSPFGIDQPVNCVAAGASVTLAVGDCSIGYVLDTSTLSTITQLPLGGASSVACALSPDNRLAAFGAENGMLTLYDLRSTGSPLLSTQITAGDAIRGLVFSPAHDRLLAVQHDRGYVDVVDCSAGACPFTRLQVPVARVRPPGTHAPTGERPDTWEGSGRLILDSAIRLEGLDFTRDGYLVVATEKSICEFRGGVLSNDGAASAEIY